MNTALTTVPFARTYWHRFKERRCPPKQNFYGRHYYSETVDPLSDQKVRDALNDMECKRNRLPMQSIRPVAPDYLSMIGNRNFGLISESGKRLLKSLDIKRPTGFGHWTPERKKRWICEQRDAIIEDEP